MNQEKIKSFLLKGIKIGIFLTLLTPLVMGPFGINLVEYPKALFFRSLMEVIFAFYIALVLLDFKYFPKKSILLGVIFLFDAILIIESIFGINFYRSFFGDMQRGEGLIMHLHLLAFFIVITSVFLKRQEWLNLLKASVLVSGISSLAAILQQLNAFGFYNMFTNNSRLSGTLSNPDLFACYIVLAIFVTIFLLVAEQNKRMKIFWWALIILNCWTLFFSGTRGSWGGFGLGLIFLVGFNFFNFNYKQKIAVAICSALVLVVVLSIFINPVWLDYVPGGNNLKRLANIDLGGRIEIWTPAILSFKDKPLFGWGFESFAFVSDKYMTTDPSAGNEHNSRGVYFDRPHNKFLELLSYSGIAGFASYFLIFAVIFYLILKYAKLWDGYNGYRKSIYSSILMAFFISYLAQSFFAFDNIGTYIFFFLVAGFINNNFSEYPAIAQEKKSLNSSEYNPAVTFKVVSIIFVFAVTIWIMYVVNIKPTVAAMYFPASIKYESTDTERAFQGYKTGIEMNTIYDSDLMIAFTDRALYLLESGYSENIRGKIVDKLSEIKPFLYKFIKNNEIQIGHIYQFVARINEQEYLLYKNPENLNEMEQVLKEAISFNPTITGFYQLMGDQKILSGNTEEGEMYMKKSCIKGICKEAELYQRIGMAYFKKGDLKIAIENFQKTLDFDYDYKKKNGDTAIAFMNPGQFIDNVAILYYRGFNDLKNCEKVYERGMESYPEYANIFKQHLDIITEDYNSKKK